MLHSPSPTSHQNGRVPRRNNARKGQGRHTEDADRIAGLGEHWRADGQPKTAYRSQSDASDRGARAPTGIRSGAERLSLRRVRGVAHGQAARGVPLGRKEMSRRRPPELAAPTRRVPGGPRLGRRRHECGSIDPGASNRDSGRPAASGTPWTSAIRTNACGRSRGPFFGVPTWDETSSPTSLLRRAVADRRTHRAHHAADAWRTAPSKHRTMSRHRIRRPAPSTPSTSCSATRTRSAITSGMFAAPWTTELLSALVARSCDQQESSQPTHNRITTQTQLSRSILFAGAVGRTNNRQSDYDSSTIREALFCFPREASRVSPGG